MIHRQIHYDLWPRILRYSENIVCIDAKYKYDDLYYEEDSSKGIYIMYYDYHYLKPSNIFEINLEEIIRQFKLYVESIYTNKSIKINTLKEYTLNFHRLVISDTMLKIMFTYHITSKPVDKVTGFDVKLLEDIKHDDSILTT